MDSICDQIVSAFSSISCQLSRTLDSVHKDFITVEYQISKCPGLRSLATHRVLYSVKVRLNNKGAESLLWPVYWLHLEWFYSSEVGFHIDFVLLNYYNPN